MANNTYANAFDKAIDAAREQGRQEGVTEVKNLRRALARLCWLLVDDHAECTCEDMDQCPECEAFNALGLGDWPGWVKAGDVLVELDR